MKILLYEYCCAELSPGQLDDSLAVEGIAMLRALLETFRNQPATACTVAVHPARSISDFMTANILRTDPADAGWLFRAVSDFDAVAVIAPESDGRLAGWIEAIEANHPQVLCLCPKLEHQRTFADKLETAKFLGPWAIPTRRLESSHVVAEFEADQPDWFDVQLDAPSRPNRLVAKPIDGAGSLHTAVCDPGRLHDWIQSLPSHGSRGRVIVQPFWPGLECSIAIVGDGQGNAIILPPVLQRIELTRWLDGIELLQYRGGKAPLSMPLAKRAHSLADYLLDIVGAVRGYFGIDLILGDDPAGRLDRIVEVNPRATTSIVLYAKVFANHLGRWLLGESESAASLADSTVVQTGQGRRVHLDFAESAGWQFEPTGEIADLAQ